MGLFLLSVASVFHYSPGCVLEGHLRLEAVPPTSVLGLSPTYVSQPSASAAQITVLPCLTLR